MSDVKRYYVGINTKCLGGIGLVEMTDLYRESTGFDGLVMGKDYDQLKAEVAGLRTGYEAYEKVNAELRAENERIERNRDMWKGQVERQAKDLALMRGDSHLLDILVEAMAEVKATSDGHSDQPIADIISGCLAEIAAISSMENHQ